jgi:hypothetical protein
MAYDHDDYGFYCDMEEAEPVKTYAHLKYKVPPRNEAYYKRLSYDIINERCDDPYICNIRSDENDLYEKTKSEMNNEKLNVIAERIQIYMHICVGCVFVATSWVLFRGIGMHY